MTPHPAGEYSEDVLIEQPAISLLSSLGWETVNAYSEFDHGDSPLGRETKSEIVLTTRLWAALEKFNPDAPTEALGQAIDVRG